MIVQNQVISVSNLRKRFNLEAGFFAQLGRYVYAVNGVSLTIGRNETYGLVGESGCGKTTTARLMVRMYEADEGEILFQSRAGNKGDESAGSESTGGESGARVLDVRKLKGTELKRYREKVKYVFQDPARSLNPRMTVYEVLTSGAKWSGERRKNASLWDEAAAILEEVGLSAADLLRRPAEFSGGQRQRISIARGLIMKPELLICDEVVSALDVSIQGQILNLLLDLRSRREISFLFIAHDLKVASYFCDRIGVMYRGELMEEAPAAELWQNGLHPYTELLFSSVNAPGRKAPEKPAAGSGPASGVTGVSAVIGSGSAGGGTAGGVSGASAGGAPSGPQSAGADTEGCAFTARCPYAEDRCYREKPELKAIGSRHLVRCHR